jgi:septal ring-binding cell division protein DamX
MRFEIGKGGVAAIFVGIALLSFAVFMCGIWLGYQVGVQNQESSAQVATAYPLAPPPEAQSSPSPTPAMSGAHASGSTVNAAGEPNPPVNTASGTATAHPNSGLGPSGSGAPAAVPSPQHLSSSAIPPPAGAATGGIGTGAPIEEATPPAASAPNESATPGRAVASTPRLRRKPYNIQIEAAMDRSGADAMMRRLVQLGYQPHLVPTEIAGQTWYKVEVGPYATQEEAQTAQEQLREKYNNAYSPGGGTPAAAATGPAD